MRRSLRASRNSARPRSTRADPEEAQALFEHSLPILREIGATWEVGDPGYESRSSNCAYAGRTLTGRVRLTTLTKETFVPGFLERDEGEREPPYEKYPWDGVSGVRPFSKMASSTTVGVY